MFIKEHCPKRQKQVSGYPRKLLKDMSELLKKIASCTNSCLKCMQESPPNALSYILVMLFFCCFMLRA